MVTTHPQAAAKLYTADRTDTPFFVVFRDPSRREQSGRAKRVTKWFAQRADAETYQRSLNERLLLEGSTGLAFDAVLRTDALAAKQILAAAGHPTCTLTELARAFIAQGTTPGADREPIGPVVLAFLEEKEQIENAAPATVVNLKNRLWPWIRRERIAFVGEITRERIESIRTRPDVSANSRRNDFGAVSSFCTWLLEKGKLAHHPVKGIRRPKVPLGPKAIYSAAQCRTLLDTARDFHAGQWVATVAVMLFVGGARPSEVAHTRIFYGRHPTARIEGGKLRGRANRTVNLTPAALAYLKAAGSPPTIKPLNSRARNQLMARSGLTYTADVLRHTCISMRQQIEQNDAAVARECGTSEGIIYRHYHQLVALAEARQWAGLRPCKVLTVNIEAPTVGG